MKVGEQAGRQAKGEEKAGNVLPNVDCWVLSWQKDLLVDWGNKNIVC